MISDPRKTPFPWFGGKRHAAPIVWAALGDPPHYVEPFFGGGAVLLHRPHLANRAYFSETVNDADGLLVNFWRAVRADPMGVADAASWPVSEADKHARSCALVRWRDEEQPAHLAGDPGFFDVVMAGWWAWTVCCQIGAWGTGGPWWPDDTGRLRKRGRPGVPASLPHLGDDGRGVNAPQLRQPGVKANLPHLVGDGQGVNAPQLRQPGVAADRPHLGDNGQGVNHAGLRQPGVSADRPHLGNNGQGVNHAGLRQPGVAASLPHLGGDGQGVNAPQLRQPGVAADLPHLVGDGRGVNHAGLREPGVGDEPNWHPHTMPALQHWLSYLSARLRHVRILQGDWARATTNGAAKTLPVRQGHGPAGIFLDPPYATTERAEGLYATDSGTVAAQVLQWCAEHGHDPLLRIVLAGYDTEHTHLETLGWRTVEWFTPGYLRGGMAQQAQDGHQQHRERLWLSPHCQQPADTETQMELFV